MKQPAAVTVTEKQFQATVVEYAEWHGWWHYHTRDSRGSEPGFPDWAFLRDGVLVLAELKAQGGRLQPGTWSKSGRYYPGQQEWLDALAAVPGLVVRLWRPSDWAEIEAVLA